LNKGDENDIKTHLSKLPSYKDDEDELGKRFDLLVFHLHLALLSGSRAQENYINRIFTIGKQLEKKRNIPAVASKIVTVREVQDMDFWNEISLLQLEKVREDLRSLIEVIDKETQDPVYANFEDYLDQERVRERDILPTYTKMKSYRDRVEAFILKNRHQLVIDKLYRNIPITENELEALEQFLANEEVGTPEEFKTQLDGQPLGKFVR